MTTQEAYEKMRVWLTRPGATRSSESLLGGSCLYLTQEGNMCAVGCLIDWDRHDPENLENIEGENVNNLLGMVYLPELRDVDIRFLSAAQQCHDSLFSWKEGVFNVKWLDKTAKRFGLTPVGAPSFVPEKWAERVPA